MPSAPWSGNRYPGWIHIPQQAAQLHVAQIASYQPDQPSSNPTTRPQQQGRTDLKHKNQKTLAEQSGGSLRGPAKTLVALRERLLYQPPSSPGRVRGCRLTKRAWPGFAPCPGSRPGPRPDECFRERVVSLCLCELRSLELSLQKEASACGSECNQ
jgi:hypothetical protein